MSGVGYALKGGDNMSESKPNEECRPRVSREELLRNPDEVMRLAEGPHGVMITNQKGEDSALIWVPTDELPASYEY